MPQQSSSLWPPCIADVDIIFLPCDFYLSIFFPRLISAIKLHGTPVVGISQNFVALNRGRHLCLAGRPSCWALATF